MRWALLVLLVPFLTACDLTQTVAPPTSGENAAADITILATQQDPCPTCVGIWLTRAASDWSQCYGNPSIDADNDALDDNCEYLVANAFAPLLMMSPGDGCPTREPYFVARPDYGLQMEIFYLLSYHRDCGSAPYGHAGDSEWIAMHVAHNNGTDRWELVDVVL